jgi:hypothetical protein
MNKRELISGIGMVLAVLAVFTAPTVAQDTNNVFHLVPVDSSCDGAGCTTTVLVRVNTTYTDINAAQASIIFDPTVVNVTNVEKGTPNWYMWDWQVYDYGTDMKYVFIGCSDVLGEYGPGELDLGTMTLQCESPSVSALHFGSQSEIGINRRTEISHPGGVICGPTGNECTMQDGTFTCVGPEETFNKPLVAGWNLISLPLTATDMKVSNIIDASLSGSYDELHKYDTSTHSFVSLSSTDTMANGVGYFIHITSPDTWTYSGSAYTTMNEGLSEGLNMVGWLNCSKDIVSEEALSSIAGSYYYAARWNATSQSYETYNPVAPGEFNDFTMMERGEGYFISAEAGCPALTKNC